MKMSKGFSWDRIIEMIWIDWLLLRFMGIGCNLVEVKERKYPAEHAYKAIQIKKGANLDEMIIHSKDIFEYEQARLDGVHRKSAMLLTAVGIFFGILSFSLPLLVWPALVIIPAVLLVSSAWVILSVIGVDTTMGPTLGQEEADKLNNSQRDFKLSIIRDYHLSALHNADVNRFLVDAYRVARRYLQFGVATQVILLTIAIINNVGLQDRIIIQLRSNPSLVRLLTGPKGDKGDKGQRGESGPRGPEGIPCLGLKKDGPR
ncbi:MAG TPA: collagen-like protein [bacterium]|nr:collagen-like protein [bacterium]